MKHLHPLNKIKLIGTALFLVAVSILGAEQLPDRVTATAGDNVHGWLFSDAPNGSDQNMTGSSQYRGRGLGYILLNNSDYGPGTFGVKLDTTTGDLSGLGFSDAGGWLDFDAVNPPLIGGTAATSAKMKPDCWIDTAQNVCPVIGWIKFTAGGTNQSGGWDGWVSLNTTSTTTPSYGVSYNKSTHKFSGHAWGDWVAGWIDFSNATVTIVDPLADMCKDNPAYPQTLGIQSAIPAGFIQSPVGSTDCVPVGTPDVCPDEANYPQTLGVQAQIPAGWHFETVQGIQVCRPDKPILGCLIPGAENYGQPAGATVNSAAMCDFCSLIPGNQSQNTMFAGVQYPQPNGPWYGLSGGICTKSVCSNYPEFVVSPRPPDVQLPDGTCGPITAWCDDPIHAQNPPCTGTTGPINPIYKEN